jgi:hypothetical protein
MSFGIDLFKRNSVPIATWINNHEQRQLFDHFVTIDISEAGSVGSRTNCVVVKHQLIRVVLNLDLYIDCFIRRAQLVFKTDLYDVFLRDKTNFITYEECSGGYKTFQQQNWNNGKLALVVLSWSVRNQRRRDGRN